MPSASRSAVSTESVMRCRADIFAVRRSMTTSIECFSCFFKRGDVADEADRAVHAHPGVALAGQRGQQVDEFALALPDDRREHLEARAVGHLEHAVDDRLRRLLGDELAADRAVRAADPGEEQPEVVRDLGDGADRRARVARGRLLVDGDRRRQTLDEVDVGLVHLPQELARVGRQRLHVPPLALGKNRVERQRGLSRTGQTGEDDQRVTRQIEVDIAQIVFTGTTDDQAFHHGIPC